LAHEAEVAADAENRAGALVAAAEISLTKLNEPRAALHHYKRLLELQPSHVLARGGAVREIGRLRRAARAAAGAHRRHRRAGGQVAAPQAPGGADARS